MTRKATLLIAFALACFTLASAQNITVKGIVKDSQGLPVPKASVKIKGLSNGTYTELNGSYSISVSPTAILIFTSIGFATQEQQVNNRSLINVTLLDDAKQLNEVVVIGYGTATKKDVTGAVSSVKATQLENENPNSVADILRGNIPGLNVGVPTTNNGAKGDGSLLVRGKTTLSASTSPLIVLDGVIYIGQLSDINPNDIESVDVLKDASSLAVFGAKAATGVVAITTKKGKSSTPVITFNTNFGVSQIGSKQKLYDGPGYLKWRADVARNGKTEKAYKYSDPNNLPEGVTMEMWLDGQTTTNPTDLWLSRLGLFANEKTNYLAGKTTNWYNEIFREGARQDHTVSISGRKEEVNYYMSLGYLENENIVKGGEFNTVRARLNLDAKAARFLTLGMNLQFAGRDEGAIPAGYSQDTQAGQYSLTAYSPYGDMYNADGTLRTRPTDDVANVLNPFLDNTYNNRLNKQNTLFGTIFGKVNLPFGFTYQLNFSPGIDMYRTFEHTSSKNPREAKGGSASRAQETRYNWQLDNLLKWNKTFASIHNFDLTLLVNAEKYQSWWTKTSNEGFAPNDDLGYGDLRSGKLLVVENDDRVFTGDALMARLQYSLRNKYLLTSSIRRDGYSAFGQKNPRAVFPAAAVAWVFTEESFLKKISWLNYGKLRLSYGINGNREIRENNTINPYSALAYVDAGKYPAIVGGTVSDISTLRINERMGNEGLKWEKTTSINAGLDFSVLQNRISGSLEVYNKKTTDLLVLQALSEVSGYKEVNSNIARVDNNGFELSLNSKNLSKENFNWSSGLIFSLNRNIIKDLGGSDNPTNGWFVNHDIDAIWDFRIQGIWQQDEAAEAAKFGKGIVPGDFKLQDVNNDYVYNDADKQFIGYKSPRFIWSLRNDFNFYKQFDFSFQLISNWGQKAQDNYRKNYPGSIGLMRSSSYELPYWTPDNPINDYARLNSGSSGNSFNVWINNSFIRLSTVSLGYSIPRSLANKAKLQSAKIYVNASNAGVYAPDWNIWDPQNDGPTPRIFSVGLNVSL